MDWNPAAYNRFAEQRNRPLLDLIDLLPPSIGGEILDLGCGDGRLTRLAVQRLGLDGGVGVDSAPKMIAAAEAGEASPVRWREADLLDVLGENGVYRLVLANASLHFCEDHPRLFPRVLAKVAPGGWVAVHLPYNHIARSHLLMDQAARSEEIGVDFDPGWPQEKPEVYARLLKEARFEHVSVQLRTYRHAIEGAEGIVAWMKSGGLQPWLDAIPADRHETFLQLYTRMIHHAYPPVDGDLRLLDYGRLLIVGRRPV